VFLDDPTDVLVEVVDYLAEQLDIGDPSVLKVSTIKGKLHPMAGPKLHHLGMAELEKPGDQMRRDAARLRPGPIVKISSVHSDVP
jgi:hypothetical protein